MQYWLMKSEPNAFSIDDLMQEKNETASWDGVRNYQARNFMRDKMRLSDQAFFYHSNCKAVGIVGVMKVVREAYPDFTAWDPEDHHFDPKSSPDNPRWVMVDVKFVKKFKTVITLPQLKLQPELKDMMVLRRGNRLSITPVSEAEWKAVMALLE